jgi:hypothetical protein
MNPTARGLVAAALGLAGSAVQALTASPQQFTVTAKLASYCMVATAGAYTELWRRRFAGTDSYWDVLMVCSKGPSISSVRLEGAGISAQPSVRLIDPRTNAANVCASAVGAITVNSGQPPVVFCASLRDRGPVASDGVSRTVRVTVTYD